jgi:hypothetical protein
MPGAGPIILFDKSALQTLTADEAVWFDTFYMPSMTPLFFVETLADLEKEMKEGRSAEDFVGALAEKTPLGGGINVHHQTLSLAELAGQKIEMRRFPILSGGRHVATRDGKKNVVFDTAPEYVALSRWADGNFLDLERQFAKDWRASLSNIDLDAIFVQGREIIKRVGRPGDLAAARVLASDLLGKTSSRFVLEALKELKPPRAAEYIVNRWKKLGSPPIASIAPYTAHIFAVDLFFCLALGADLIGRERQTNKIDMAYLYYLPFCMVFTSRDKLHAKTARLFLNSDQVFLPGDELKADLSKLDEHYSKLPDEVKLRGVMSFAHFPPHEGDFLISRLWDQLMRPGWREYAANPPEIGTKEEQSKILAKLDEITDAPPMEEPPEFSMESADSVTIKRSIPLYRGKWRMLPPEVEKSPDRKK